jgi:hypothetical protein
MAEKDAAKPKCEASKSNKDSRRTTFGPSHRSESAFADDAMLEDGFDAHTAEVHARRNARQEQDFDDIVVGGGESLDDEMEEESAGDESDSVESSEDEIEGELIVYGNSQQRHCVAIQCNSHHVVC